MKDEDINYERISEIRRPWMHPCNCWNYNIPHIGCYIMNDNENKLALMIEKLLYIIAIDEQIIKYNEDKTYLSRHGIAKRALLRIRGSIKQSLQADLNKLLGKRDLKAFEEIKKSYDREDIYETEDRLKNAVKSIIPSSRKHKEERMDCDDAL